MKRSKSRRDTKNYLSLYSATTEPVLPHITMPIPARYLPRKSVTNRPQGFVAGIVHFIRQMLVLALVLVLLLLSSRVVLTYFHLSLGEFSSWVFRLSTPLVDPFGRLLSPLPPLLPYSYYTIDLAALLAMVAYILGVALIRWILKPAPNKTAPKYYSPVRVRRR